jgi:excisionase family DNA binding protein
MVAVSVKTVYRRLEEGVLPGRKVGRQWRIDAADVPSMLTPPAGLPRVGPERPPRLLRWDQEAGRWVYPEELDEGDPEA